MNMAEADIQTVQQCYPMPEHELLISLEPVSWRLPGHHGKHFDKR